MSTLRAAVEDHTVVAVGRDAAVLAPVNGLVVDRAGDGAVVDDGTGAGLAVVGDTGDDAGIGAHGIRTRDVDLRIRHGEIAHDRTVNSANRPAET